ncbi:peptidoglycan-binding protein, partial [Rhabdochromatium marinum]|uniref:peptidoglycan-binding protein n=1 Tax=Rhabdochromatium marinum TaxID=48729 RepID=UPI001908AD0F
MVSLWLGINQVVAQPSSEEPNPEDIRFIQTNLQEQGYGIGTVNGLLTRQTIDAIRQFERDNDLGVHPYLDAATLAALRDQLEARMPASRAFELPLAPSSLEQGYHALSNEELLEQALTRYQQVQQRFHAEQRHLHKLRILYRQLEQINADWQPTREFQPPETPETQSDANPQAIGIAQAEQRLNSYQEHLTELERQLEVLNRVNLEVRNSYAIVCAPLCHASFGRALADILVTGSFHVDVRS